jgi:hypothetical protein
VKWNLEGPGKSPEGGTAEGWGIKGGGSARNRKSTGVVLVIYFNSNILFCSVLLTPWLTLSAPIQQEIMKHISRQQMEKEKQTPSSEIRLCAECLLKQSL